MLFNDTTQHHLHMALCLHVATHHAERHFRLTITRHEGGDNRVHGALAACDLIGVARGRDKTRAAIL